ncbi:MAG: Hsp20 family protein [Candidatus Altiarchaeales archaeon]|nr:Hsp20 family protein [Candidatus Altiarchaeales archaeon]MBD3417142.1 Hsp20 family protein [Candidatus Altiarchaeales archaeon]
MMEDDFPRKRGRRFFDGFFDDDLFGMDFRRIHEQMDKLMRDAFKDFENVDVEPGKSYVYGFTMRTGPDGKPHVEEFGNVPRPGVEPISGGREPLVDVIDGKEQVSVIAELPGVDKKDIDLNAGERTLSIKVDTEGRKYHKELKLPADVDPDSVKATYKNGILDVKLKRREKKEEPKKKVRIE